MYDESTDISDFVVQFVDESEESLNEVINLAISLNSSPDNSEGIDYMFRILHTIKGNASILGFLKVKRIAHILEEFIGAIRSGSRVIDERFLDVFIKGGDLMIRMFGNIRESMSEGNDIEYDDFINRVEKLKL